MAIRFLLLLVLFTHFPAASRPDLGKGGFCTATYTSGWRGIVPLHSTRAQVERLLGTGSGSCKCVYDLQDEIVQMTYSEGDCLVGGSGGWNIPPDTVIRFNIQPKTRQSFAAFLLDAKLDSKAFTVTEDPELPGIFYYKDATKGLIVSVENERVRDYGFEPTSEEKSLRCPTVKTSNRIRP